MSDRVLLEIIKDLMEEEGELAARLKRARGRIEFYHCETCLQANPAIIYQETD